MRDSEPKAERAHAPPVEIAAGAVGKRTRTMGSPAPLAVQLRAAGAGGSGDAAPGSGSDAVHLAARDGVSGPGEPLPHGDRIQRLFGRHDVSGVQAHVGGAAAEATQQLGALAYATGDHVAFGAAPDLHTAAHEAAHVVQQRAGVQLKAGVGAVGDSYEQHADAVADRVVRGESAEELLGEVTGRGGGAEHAPVQRQQVQPPGGPAQGAQVAQQGAQAPPPMTQADYDAAVLLLQARNAAMYNVLRQGRLGQVVAARVVNAPIAGAGPGSPTAITITFNLEITAGTIAGAVAQFADVNEVINMTPPTVTVTQRLPMAARLPTGANPTTSLAELLFHEGLHMQLKMDRLMSSLMPGASQQQSGTLASLQGYLTQAQASPAWSPFLLDLEAFIDLYFHQPGRTSPGPAYSRTAARKVAERIIEERFAIDQQRAQFAGSTASAAGATIANAYLVRYLGDEGVAASATNPDVVRLVTQLTTVLGAITAPAAPAAPAAPTGSAARPHP